MSERGGREGLTRRSSYRKLLSETALPSEYLEALEQKRRQLDDSIHKYIASKEREYKNFEKDVRQQHKLGSGHNTSNGVGKSRTAPETTTHDDGQTTLLERQLISVASSNESDSRGAETNDDALRVRDKSSIAGLKDGRASVEREKDFIGVFTPRFLPALDDKDARHLERTSSAPSTVPTSSRLQPDGHASSLERAYSDTMVQAKAKRPSQLALTHRTSSSGSSADGKLASAMKSPTQRPKRKRVSLAVGDSIVAPSDSVPVALSHNSTPSHSRIRSPIPERENTVTAEKAGTREATERPSIESSSQIAEGAVLGESMTEDNQELQERTPASAQKSLVNRTDGSSPSAAQSRIDPDGDLFGLEEELDLPTPQQDSDDSESALESEDEITGRVDNMEGDPSGVRYDPTTGVIPEPEDGTDSAVPYLAFGPGSAVASQQPTQPGFRRPSVVRDPVYRGLDYQVAEEDAVENDVYGSSYNRPASKGSFTVGSLGETYMAQHAEEMMKLRSSTQQT